jgi:hypothetical protein
VSRSITTKRSRHNLAPSITIRNLHHNNPRLELRRRAHQREAFPPRAQPRRQPRRIRSMDVARRLREQRELLGLMKRCASPSAREKCARRRTRGTRRSPSVSSLPPNSFSADLKSTSLKRRCKSLTVLTWLE